MDEKNKEPQIQPQATEGLSLPRDFRAIVMYGMSKEEALAIMKVVKAISPSLKDTAFAMTTETNIAWPLGQLIVELSEEHRMMRRLSKAREEKSGADESR